LVITVCGIIVGAGFMLMSRVTALWQLYLFLGILAGTGMSGVWVPQLSTIARWFLRRRTLMSGIVISGVSIGGLVAPLVIIRLIEAGGWRNAYIILGGLLLVVMVAAAQFQRRHPADMGLKPYGEGAADANAPAADANSYTFRQAARTAQFWIACLIFFCLGFCLFSVLVHIVPHVTDLGISPLAAAGILSLAGGLAILGNYTLGGLADRIGNRWVFIIGFILMTAAYLWLLTADVLWMFYVFAVIYSLAHGGLGAAESPLAAGLFGVGSHGLIYGVAHIGFTAGAALGPLLTGYSYDATGSYQTAFIVCAGIGVLGVLLSVILRPVANRPGRI
jgi:MFS family permease